jgi:hypothetical protein
MTGLRGTRRASVNVTAMRVRVADVLVTVVRWVGSAAAALLAIHVVLTVFGANPANGITRFFREWARPLALGFETLFTPADPQLAVLVNYGLAALFWLFITSLAIRILRALGGR